MMPTPPDTKDPSRTFFTPPGYSSSIRLDTITRVWSTRSCLRVGALHIERTSGPDLIFRYPAIADADLAVMSLKRALRSCGMTVDA